MDEMPAHSFTCFLRFINTAQDAYAVHLAAAADACGLTKQEADVLIFLANNPQFHTARDVAEFRGISRAYVSKAVDGLGGKALLTVHADTGDRRYQTLVLTDTARPAVAALRAAQTAFFKKLTHGVSAADRAALERFITQCSINAQALRTGDSL